MNEANSKSHLLSATNLISPINMHNIYAHNFRTYVDKSSMANLSISKKKFLHYLSLATIFTMGCSILHTHNANLLSSLIFGGVVGSTLQGAPHCEDQINLEKKFPKTSLIVGLAHGVLCSLTCSVFHHLASNSFVSNSFCIALHSASMSYGMCFNENKVLRFMDQYFKNKDCNVIKKSCCIK